ncbi:hypothetical protein [Actinomycetospora sp. TBRC 11914]|uniref:hypothetical protein n=1 Tax=Actinomycetospora sp. TBRC 11914 TaxID=2729387 RepID=UPI00145E700F|nr:hypothetical protein [Actinomycetospora sp. TBRC 11914]NMO93608.1 DUF2339 domain-containing protein [Actinomycetospora sp. TBRC 11914]
MTRAGDPDDLGGPLGYSTGDGRVPKLVVVAIAWAVFGLVGLFAALLLHSAGFAVFGVLCVLAGGGLYLAQRTREQLAYDESHPEEDPLVPEDPDLAEEAVEEHRAAEQETRMYAPYDPDDDILDAEFTEYFEYEQSPADQDDGTGYDDEEVAYQRFRDDQRARESQHSEAEQDDEGGEDEDDDVARTSRIPAGEHDADHEPSDGRRR